MTHLTQSKLKELLRYDPKTGVFIRLVRTANCVHVGDVAGSLDGGGYVLIGVCGVKYGAHRLAWLYMTGEWPTNLVDHKDTDPSNNRWKNLRDATHSVNGQNRCKPNSNNITGFQGVSPSGEGFMARIRRYKKKQLYLGVHSTPELANAVYLDAKRKLHAGCTL